MNRVLVLDSRGGQDRDLAHFLVPDQPAADIACAERVGDRAPTELVAIDYGDAASEAVVRDALRYRTENPRCRVAVVRVLDPSWAEVECHARIASLPAADRALPRIKASSVRKVIAPDPDFEMRIDPDAVLFEYAA